MKTIAKSVSLQMCPPGVAVLFSTTLVAFALIPQPIGCFAQTSLEIQVGANNDDAEEDDDGSVTLDNSELEFGQQQWIGFRFNSVAVPQGATITSAYVEIRATEDISESTDLTIFGQDADDAETFGAGNYNLSIRPKTDASVDWRNVENWMEDQWHDTPDITAIIQEIVNRSGWVDENDLVILIWSDDLDGERLAFSHDDSGNKAAKLHIEYVDSKVPLGHWVFDEDAGATAADSSASANDAALQGAATWTSSCSGASAIEFDGSGAYAITAQPFSPPSTGTVAFWMRSAGSPAARSRIFGLGNNWEGRQEPDGTLSFDLGAEGPPEFVTLTSLDQADQWYHVVVVFDKADDSFQVYVDGQLDNSGVNGDDMVAQSAGQLSFGTRTGSSDYWEGALRDFRVYDTKLTAEEVVELYGVIAYWKLNESSGLIVVDSSGRGNDATYVNLPTLGVNGAFPPKTDTAVRLDGATEYITSNQSLLNDVEEFTLAGWFRPDQVALQTSFFGQNDVIEVGIKYDTNRLHFWTAASGQINSTGLLPIGQWSHIAAVGNGAVLRLYVDGVEVGSGGTATANYGTSTYDFKIGEGVYEPSGDFFDGRIDDVRVYSRALCPEEINAVYKGGRPGGVRILQWLETR